MPFSFLILQFIHYTDSLYLAVKSEDVCIFIMLVSILHTTLLASCSLLFYLKVIELFKSC